MAVPTIADVRNLAPEFRDVVAIPDAEVTVALNDAIGEVDTSGVAWGTATNRGIILLAAHFLAVNHPELSQAQKVRTYETPGAEDAGALGATRWGREYYRLMNSQLNTRLPVVSSAGTYNA